MEEINEGNLGREDLLNDSSLVENNIFNQSEVNMCDDDSPQDFPLPPPADELLDQLSQQAAGDGDHNSQSPDLPPPPDCEELKLDPLPLEPFKTDKSVRRSLPAFQNYDPETIDEARQRPKSQLVSSPQNSYEDEHV